ncbi:MAG: hypothetical protein AW07_02702 [Candidatus Accumulibacter sp. SK-11]|nr:MAG: hypothetical protein AW07_02702 [Candidatus Accumulibacter sp. SK-11]
MRKKATAAISPTVSAIDANARRSGKRHCRLESGRPSFKPTEKREINNATSATRSRMSGTCRGSGVISPQPAVPRPKPAAR